MKRAALHSEHSTGIQWRVFIAQRVKVQRKAEELRIDHLHIGFREGFESQGLREAKERNQRVIIQDIPCTRHYWRRREGIWSFVWGEGPFFFREGTGSLKKILVSGGLLGQKERCHTWFCTSIWPFVLGEPSVEKRRWGGGQGG